jgi:glycosyltransferase involved in cell wall biosynthesis
MSDPMESNSEVLFTVITPALNCAEFIRRNIESVRHQGVPANRLEHWVIDGGSTDETVEILKTEPDVLWISERDKGLSDAVNKGICRAKGEWIAWLNADDELFPGALATVLEWSARFPDADIFCGDETILRYDGTQEQVIKGRPYTYDDLLAREPGINQASTFLRRRLVERIGGLDVSIRDAMDYEWLVRATRVATCVYIPRVLSIYHRRKGSIMDSHMVDFFRTFRAVRRIHHRKWTESLEWLSLYYIWTEPLRRIKWFREIVRWVKRCFGREPLHPC